MFSVFNNVDIKGTIALILKNSSIDAIVTKKINTNKFFLLSLFIHLLRKLRVSGILEIIIKDYYVNLFSKLISLIIFFYITCKFF